jgi:hypothetical protein
MDQEETLPVDRSKYPTRLTSLHDPEDETHVLALSAAERIHMVERLTRAAWAFMGEPIDGARLRRDVVRVVRRGS